MLYNYYPLYVTVFIAKGGKESVHVLYLGKKKFSSAIIIEVPITDKLKKYRLIYSIIPYNLHRHSGGFRQKAYADLKRVGIDPGDIVYERNYFEKYGIIGPTPEVPECINNQDLKLVGRLGTWRELSVHEIVEEFG